MQETKEISQYKQSLRGTIVETAMEAFRHRGIRAVKMDDVASEMGISKRTIYEIFDNKESLLYEGMLLHKDRRIELLKAQTARCENVMEIILTVYRYKVDELRQTSPQFFEDLVLYPKVSQFIKSENHRIKTHVYEFMERGVKEGYFRKTVNAELVSVLFDVIGKYVMENRLYGQYSLEAIFENLILAPIRGICTPKGVEKLDKFDFLK